MNEYWPGARVLATVSGINTRIGPPTAAGLCRRYVCAHRCVTLCVRAHLHSSWPQIELLINRPMPTWQSLSFSITISIISQILLIWQNPKTKQSSPPSSAQPTEKLHSLEPGALFEQWVLDVWDSRVY